jgi:lysophospholipase L1-like esterase
VARRRPLLAAGLGVALAAAAVAAMELGARALEARTVPDHSVPLASGADALAMPPHPYLLWEHSPGARQEQGVAVHINSLGLRGPEPAIPKPAGTRRILALGDSSVYGFGVPLERSFVHDAAQRLGGGAAGLEGIPVALPGYSTLQLLNLLELRALALEPDVLVVAALWSDHATAAAQDAALMDRYQRHSASGRAALERTLQGSALVRLLTWELGVRRGAQAEARAHYDLRLPHPEGDTHRVPLAAYRTNLDALAATAQDQGAELLFLILPHPEDLEGRQRGVSSFQGYRDAMRQAALAHSAPIVEGGEIFSDAAIIDPAIDRQALFMDNIHPTALGHGLLGEALAEALKRWERETRP